MRELLDALEAAVVEPRLCLATAVATAGNSHIGSDNALEIAPSIMAQVLAVSRERRGGRL